MNLILDTDSYKFSHFKQYPKGTNGLYCYLESRGGLYPATVFFGLQMLLHNLCQPLTMDQVDEAETFAQAHGFSFNRAGWTRIVQLGYLPIIIRAVAEGTVVPTRNVLMTVENTDDATAWIVTYLETLLMRVWYPITVATHSYFCRQLIMEFLQKTSDDPENEIWFKLHDFGSRGVSSQESAAIGGAAHLVNFKGSDTVAGVVAANQYYRDPMAAFSIPAMEHSTVTAFGPQGEEAAFSQMLDEFGKPGALVACVSDSYDLTHAVREIWGKKLVEKVKACGATVVIRPDSGNPHEVVLECLKILEVAYGVTLNSKGYKVLNHVRVIQGDGIDRDMIREILETITVHGFSATNVAFGMGGGLLQQVNRDTQKFAYKCSLVAINGESRPISKNPKGAPWKASRSGRLALVCKSGVTYETVSGDIPFNDELVTVFKDGVVTKEWTLEEVRSRCHSGRSVREL